MEYRLNQVVKIIENALSPSGLKNQANSKAQISSQLAIIDEIIKGAPAHLRFLLSGYDHLMLRHFVPLYQKDIITSMDLLFFYTTEMQEAKTKKDSALAKTMWVKIGEGLKELLQFITLHFDTCLNRHQTLPEADRNSEIPAIGLFAEEVEKKLAQLGIDARLIRIVCTPLNYFINKDNPITYHRLVYIKRFMLNLQVKLIATKLNDRSIRFFLIEEKYNDYGFYEQYLSIINEQAADCKDDIALLLVYYKEMRDLQKNSIKQCHCYNSLLPNIAKSIHSFLLAEMTFLERKLNLHQREEPPMEIATDDKILLSLSVKELVLSLNVLIDTRIILNTNYAGVVRWVAAHFSTKKAADPSVTTMTRNTTQFEPRLVNRVRDKIMILFNGTHKYLGR